MEDSNKKYLLPNQVITMPKETLAGLPIAEYNGEIHLIENPNEVDAAVAELRAAGIVGFDTETKPSFKRGVHNKVALVQLSTLDKSFLFRINRIGLDSQILDLLTDETITKIGLSVRDDFLNLSKIADFEPAEFIDLQQYVKQFEIEDNSLQKIYAILFGERITKGQRLSNWEGQVLTPAQQRYAALDAYACLRIYNYLESGQFDPTRSPYIVTREPEPLPTEE